MCYPPASKASREVENFDWKKIHMPPCLERKPVFRLSSIFWLKLANLGKENASKLKLTVLDASRVKQRFRKSPYSLLPKFPTNTEILLSK